MEKRTNLPNGGCMIEHSDGTNFWYNQKGQHHREDGPAIESSNGKKRWYLNGMLHRLDGPAMEFRTNGMKIWYVWYFFGKFFVERKRQ